MTEDAFKQHIIYYGVESAAPQFGTSIAVLKGWMRGDSALPQKVWGAWINYSSLPPELRPPIAGSVVNTRAPQTLEPELPGPIVASSLAQRVLADPAIAARIKAETSRAPVVERPAESVSEPVVFEGEIPVASPAGGNGETKKGAIAFCCVTDRDFPPTVMEAFSVLIRNHQMPIILKSETLLVRGRNIIAERFLRSRAEWSFWVDSDMLIPFGSADWFRDKSKITNLRPDQYGFDAVKRLLSHRQNFVGGVYAARTEGSQLVIQPDLEPRHDGDKALADSIRKNQSYGLKSVGWLAFGCCLVHRRVFEAIGRVDPDIRSGKAGFFDTQGGKGEDIRFSERAVSAGFRPQLDVELVCGHLGRKCFKPQDTKGRA